MNIGPDGLKGFNVSNIPYSYGSAQNQSFKILLICFVNCWGQISTFSIDGYFLTHYFKSAKPAYKILCQNQCVAWPILIYVIIVSVVLTVILYYLNNHLLLYISSYTMMKKSLNYLNCATFSGFFFLVILCIE